MKGVAIDLAKEHYLTLYNHSRKDIVRLRRTYHLKGIRDGSIIFATRNEKGYNRYYLLRQLGHTYNEVVFEIVDIGLLNPLF